MDEDNLHRKLSAIFSADVAGYSHLMGEDEMATIKILSEYREFIHPDWARGNRNISLYNSFTRSI